MSKNRPPYPPEFRQKILELVRAGRTPEELSREFEPTAQCIRNWIAQAGVEECLLANGSKQTATHERDELERLRRENKVLREEREILKKAAAWFAQEIGVPSVKRSNT